MSRAKRKGRPRKARMVSLARMPFNGDHGTATAAANQGTKVEPIRDDNGRNPNHMARRRRVEVIESLDLTMRQQQAAKAIRNAYCRSERLSSGGPLKEKVQASPKPDATIAMQCDVTSDLVNVMKAVPSGQRALIEGVCWHNLEVAVIGRRLGLVRPTDRLRTVLDLVADHLRY